MKNFEERLERLEDLSEKVRDGNIPLAEATSYFEEGIKLARGLEKDLQKIERKIEILVNQPESEEEPAELALFPEFDAEEKGTE
jgi:exodeoxyribonuclease VII small subunit